MKKQNSFCLQRLNILKNIKKQISLKALKEIKDLFLIAEDSKIIVKDFKKFKKYAEKLKVFIKE